MENKKQSTANRILYIALAAVLCVSAIVGGIFLARRDVPSDTPVPDTPVGGVEDPTLILPEFVAPAVGLVTKGHDTDTLVYFNTTDDWRVHKGIDISCALGDAVMAAADGKVTSIEESPLMGTTVTLSHNGGAVTVYSNLAPQLAEGIEVGSEVKCGATLGCVGESSMLELAEEPHLHFEMTVNGEWVDPMDFITEESKSASLSQDVAFEG